MQNTTFNSLVSKMCKKCCHIFGIVGKVELVSDIPLWNSFEEIINAKIDKFFILWPSWLTMKIQSAQSDNHNQQAYLIFDICQRSNKLVGCDFTNT